MPAPITLDGPHRPRLRVRLQRSMPAILCVVAGALVAAAPHIAALAAAFME